MNLFSEIVYMAIVSSVIGIVILGIRKILKNKISPKYRYLIWSIFIISLIVPIRSLGNFNIYEITEFKSSIENIKVYKNTEFESFDNEIVKNISVNNITKYKTYKEYIAIAIELISILCFIRYMLRYLLFLKYINKDKLHDERINRILEYCKSELNIKRNFEIVPQAKIRTPAIFGIFKMRILMPKEVLKMPDENLTGILMHELSHYKRKDNYVNIIFQFAKIVYWFNPIVYICIRNIRNDIELETDEMAISKFGDKNSFKYCETMIAVAAMSGARRMPIIGFASATEVLEERIDMIIAREKFEKSSTITAIICFAIIAVVWITLCPTISFGEEIPDLYVTVSGRENYIEIDRNKEKVIKINKDDSLEFNVAGNKNITYLVYDKTDLKSMRNSKGMVDEVSNKITYFEPGEYLYKFSIKYNNQIIDYKVKLIIE